MIHILPEHCYLRSMLSSRFLLPVNEKGLAASIISCFYCVFPLFLHTYIYNLYSEKCLYKQLADDPYMRPLLKNNAFLKMYI